MMHGDRFLLFVLAAGTALAQHTFTPGDVEDGAVLYRGTCLGCHGPDGNNVPGIDLAHGKYKRANNDDQVVSIIRNGVPNTAMPPSNVTEFQASTIVAYLHSIGTTAGAAGAGGASSGGDAARGKAIFEGKGGCVSCHRIRGQGARTGPDLSDVGSFRRAPEIEKSIVDPDAEILPQNRFVHVVTKNGATYDGRLMNEDTFNVMILDSKEQLRAFPRSDLKEFTFTDKSPMPSYKGRLSTQEIADLVAYLNAQKGVEVK